jgi:chemotaxis protein CheZ
MQVAHKVFNLELATCNLKLTKGGSMSEISGKQGLAELIDATKAMSEGNFYKELNIKLQGELGELAKYIDKTRKSLQKLDPPVSTISGKIPQASSHLFDITKATEEATHKVLSITEKVMDDQEKMSEKIAKLRDAATAAAVDGPAILKIAREIEEINSNNKGDLIEILTALSFQDLTGQKIKKIVALVQEVEMRVLELLLSFGIVKEDWHEKVIGQLKDPTKGIEANQGLVDDILKKLGM